MVIPEPGRQAILAELHEHSGICSKIKSLARIRMYVWWPGLDPNIEKSVCLCQACQANQSLPPQVPLNPSKWPSKLWSRLHLDFVGPFENEMFLVWIETFVTHGSTSSIIKRHLQNTFARFGLPDTIMMDNGTCFVSAEFKAFLKSNGIRLAPLLMN